MANRSTVKSNIIAQNVPTVTNAILTGMLNTELADNIRFREDVAVIQSAAASNITVDFTGKDRVDLTRTGGSLNLTLNNIGDGETKFLLITKTSGQAVTFVGVTDITPIKANANALSLVLYEVVRKGTNYFAKAWVENVKTASETIEGVLEVGTAAECNALSVINKIVTPGRIPVSSTTQRGVIETATTAEGNAFTSNVVALTPGTNPKATETQGGAVMAAPDLAVYYGTDTSGAFTYSVRPSQAKSIKDTAAAALLITAALAFTGTSNSHITSLTINGRKFNKVQTICGLAITDTYGVDFFVKNITGYVSPGYDVVFPMCGKDNLQETGMGRIATNGDVYISPNHSSNEGWVFNVTIIGA
jgi:hypothetical protein